MGARGERRRPLARGDTSTRVGPYWLCGCHGCSSGGAPGGNLLPLNWWLANWPGRLAPLLIKETSLLDNFQVSLLLQENKTARRPVACPDDGWLRSGSNGRATAAAGAERTGAFSHPSAGSGPNGYLPHLRVLACQAAAARTHRHPTSCQSRCGSGSRQAVGPQLHSVLSWWSAG